MKDYREIIKNAGLKITPQRISVLKAIEKLKKHPSVDEIIEAVHKVNPDIATGTIYNILDSFVEKKIIAHVKTDKDVMRYDSVLKNHHHLYCSKTGKISDYYDQELDELIENHFKNKKIEGFSIEDIKLQIMGKYESKNKK